MITRIRGSIVEVYNSTGNIVRRISCSSTVQVAYVSGDVVNVQLANGHVEIYGLNGNVIRRI